jgi:hypothetical protein
MKQFRDLIASFACASSGCQLSANSAFVLLGTLGILTTAATGCSTIGLPSPSEWPDRLPSAGRNEVGLIAGGAPALESKGSDGQAVTGKTWAVAGLYGFQMSPRYVLEVPLHFIPPRTLNTALLGIPGSYGLVSLTPSLKVVLPATKRLWWFATGGAGVALFVGQRAARERTWVIQAGFGAEWQVRPAWHLQTSFRAFHSPRPDAFRRADVKTFSSGSSFSAGVIRRF